MKNKQFTQSDVGAVPRPKVVERVVEKPRQPMLIELHRKQDKLIIIIANAIFLSAIAMAFFAFSEMGRSLFAPDTGLGVAGFLMVVSFAVHGYGRFMMWWNNE